MLRTLVVSHVRRAGITVYLATSSAVLTDRPPILKKEEVFVAHLIKKILKRGRIAPASFFSIFLCMYVVVCAPRRHRGIPRDDEIGGVYISSDKGRLAGSKDESFEI